MKSPYIITKRARVGRRSFLQTIAAGALGASIGCGREREEALPALDRPIPRRMLGKTGVEVSMLALGGAHLANNDIAGGTQLVHRALDLGVNFMDNAESYLNGHGESVLGEALKGRRDEAFVMTKALARSRQGAQEQLEGSLRRLQTDVIDLYQIHGVRTIEEVEEAFGPNGAMETIVKARKEGKVRFIGMTGHFDPNVHAYAIRKYGDELDTVQMPINLCDPSHPELSFIRQVLPLLLEKGIAPLAMKSAAAGNIVSQGVATIDECLRFTLSHPVATVVSGMENIPHLEHNVRVALGFTPMSDEEKGALVARAAPHAGGGVEKFKKATPEAVSQS